MSRSRVASLLSLSAVIVAAATLSAASSMPMVSSEAQSQQVHKPGSGVTLPVVVHEVKPAYTPEALQQKIHGSVVLGIVVLADGTVGDITVEHSLDATYGLDQQAIDAAKQWTFKPGTKDGKPVAVSVTFQMVFTLK